ncbi:MAG: 5-formyltetrahydrofolate cyclo-ligase [Tannerellaceae bacterium]|nr:5-formyltetrahydrofolate cyclo-ligase [Tannerellaceae bacterium]
MDKHSDAILTTLVGTPEFRQARSVAFYYALPDEVQTARFLNEWHTRKQLFLPVVKGDEIYFERYEGEQHLQSGSFGIAEPILKKENKELDFDLIVVPGVAFDRQLNRMGRGKGYYDRFLTQTKAHKTGICFDFQLFDQIPAASFDIKMDRIITEKEIIEGSVQHNIR